MMKSTLLLALGALCLGTLRSDDDEKRWFVDQNLVYEHGSALSTEYLRQHTPEFEETVHDTLPWVVRIEVQHTFVEGRYSSNHGSGIILEGGLVLTAGHVLTQSVGEGERKVFLTLVDGRVIPAEVVEQGKKDWALLRLTPGDGQDALLKSPVSLGRATPNELVVFAGYPARLGLDETGTVRSFHNGDAENGIPVSKLAPMLVVATVAEVQAMTLAPQAGFPPVGGMSGGPLLNSAGDVIGVQISVSKTTENATGRVLNYTINAVSAGAVTR